MELSRGYQSDCACEKNILLTNVRRRNKDIKAVKSRRRDRCIAESPGWWEGIWKGSFRQCREREHKIRTAAKVRILK